MMKSCDEIRADLSSLRVQKNEKTFSLDVESLFTSVPVIETINTLLERSYHHQNLPSPSNEKRPDARIVTYLHHRDSI